MAMSKGSAAAGTGMAGDIFDKLNTEFGPFDSRALEAIHRMCDAIADGIVTHITGNAVAVIAGTTGGATGLGDLQKDSTGALTDPPVDDAEIPIK